MPTLESLQNIKLAWIRTLSGENADYRNLQRVELDTFAWAEEENLLHLQKELNDRIFSPNRTTKIYLPKPSGLLRPISILRVRDTIIYQAIANVMAAKARKKHSSYYFKTVFSNVLTMQPGYPYFYRNWRYGYGNFRHAYRKWVGMTKEAIDQDVKANCCLFQHQSNVSKKRSAKLIEIEQIPKDKLWYLGYVSQKETRKDSIISMAILYKSDQKRLKWDKLTKQLQKEIKTVADERDQSVVEKWLPQIEQLFQELDERQTEMERIKKAAINNTNIYLSWDYMDVYVATSMRESWEFADVNEFVDTIFNNPDITDFNLRFFDPTQSWIEDRIEKGLIEALMLKRAMLTFYLAQETDSLGKDSELAITLAQGKPVIAYIPEINVKEHAIKISGHPLKFFRKRISILDAEDIFPELKPDIKIEDYDKLEKFKDKLGEHFSNRTFIFNLHEEKEFKEENAQLFKNICNIIAIAEKSYFDKRADLLKRVHPLGLQVDLKTGVANGVLVVRDTGQCIELLKRLLTGNMRFEIENKANGLFLKEEVSESCFRVVTNNEKITNSFWNFYLS